MPNPGGLPAMPDSELNFNVNKDTGGFCAGVSYTTAAFNLDDCLAAYNAILSDCESFFHTPAITSTAHCLLHVSVCVCVRVKARNSW